MVIHFLYQAAASLTACHRMSDKVPATTRPADVTCQRCLKAGPVVRYHREERERPLPGFSGDSTPIEKLVGEVIAESNRIALGSRLPNVPIHKAGETRESNVKIKRSEYRLMVATLDNRLRDLDMLLHALRDRTDGFTDVSEIQAVYGELLQAADAARQVKEQLWAVVS